MTQNGGDAPRLTQTAFDISGVLSHEEGIGSIFRAILGYSANPEWLTLIVHVSYIVVVLALYLRPLPARPAPAKPAPQTTGS